MQSGLKITNDVAFQEIFGKPGNEKITKGFLEKILNVEIEDLTLDNNKKLYGEYASDKIGIVDVKARLADGTKVIVEMQVARYPYMSKRLLYYWAKTYGGDLRRGEDYIKLDKTVAILITATNMPELEGVGEYHSILDVKLRKHKERRIMEDFEIHIIELEKFNGGDGQPEDNWLRFIKGENMDRVKKMEKEIEEAREELIRITSDPVMREQYEDREKALRDFISFVSVPLREIKEARSGGIERGREEGIKQGREEGIRQGKEEGIKQGKEEGIRQGKAEGIRQGKEEGIRQGKQEIICKMHEKGMSIKEISDIVNLSEEQVKEYINKDKK